jgi:hypothetical protein
MNVPIIVRYRFIETTFNDYVAAEIRYLSVSGRDPLANLTTGKSKILMGVGLCLLGLGVTAVSVGATKFWPVGLLGCLMIGLPILEPWLIRRRLKKGFKANYKDTEFEWTIDDKEITVETRTASANPTRSTFGWEMLSAAVDSSHGLLLYGPQSRCWLPLNGFVEQSQIEVFRSLVASKNPRVSPLT